MDIFCLMFFKDRTIVLICQGGKRRKKEILFPGYPTNMSEKSLDLAPHIIFILVSQSANPLKEVACNSRIRRFYLLANAVSATCSRITTTTFIVIVISTFTPTTTATITYTITQSATPTAIMTQTFASPVTASATPWYTPSETPTPILTSGP